MRAAPAARHVVRRGHAAAKLPKVVWREGGLVAVSKPAGLASQGGVGLAGNNLVDVARAQFGAPRVAVLHRLDRNVSGLVLLALDARTARFASAQLRERSIDRQYVAVVLGDPPTDAFEVSAWLRKDPESNESAALSETAVQGLPPQERRAWKPALTRFEVLERFTAPIGRCAVLRARLVTGRSHQIRAHLAHAGLPLIGDPKYGVLAQGLERPLLHAEHLAFETPRGERVELHDPPPWSSRTLRTLRSLGGSLAASPHRAEPSAASAPRREPLEHVYGLSAVLAAFRARPEAAAKIVHTREQRFALRDVLREAAQRRIAYREVEADELSRMCEAQHHEGVCLWLRAAPAPALEHAIGAVGTRGAMLALDGVENPHNVGAIVRTAAYFGLRAVLVHTAAGRALPAAATRIAEGGAEHVEVVAVRDLPAALHALHDAGFEIVGTDVRAERAIDEHTFAARCVVVLGNEREGMTPAVRACCSPVLAIPGSGALDSLNVSVTAGIVAHALHTHFAGAS